MVQWVRASPSAGDPVWSTFQAHPGVWQDGARLSASAQEAPGSEGAVCFRVRTQRGAQLFAAVPARSDSSSASPSLAFLKSIIAQKLQKKQS